MYKVPDNLNDFSYKKIEDVQNKNVIIRASLDVAVDTEGRVMDATRFIEALPLMKELAGTCRSLIITAHLSRPEPLEEGQTPEPKYSFWNVVGMLQTELSMINSELKVQLINDLSDSTIDTIKNNTDKNTVFFVENIRFFKGEESKDSEERLNFAKRLAMMADVFINDAFPAYREAASTYDIAKVIPSYLGPVFLKEVESLGKFNNPDKPFVAILGGAKLSEKLDALNALGEIADKVIIGGAMAYTLMKAIGIETGDSLIEEDKLEVAKEIIAKYKDKLVLPVDHVVVPKFEDPEKCGYAVIDNENVNWEYGTVFRNLPTSEDGDEILLDELEKIIAVDIGPKTTRLFEEAIESAKYILWNGPMGVFEWDRSGFGTSSIGKAIVRNSEAFKLAGGGDSIAAINKFKLEGFDHISTGGGAMLAFLAYDKFPILDVIVNK